MFTFTGKGTETDTGTRPKELDGAGLLAGRDTPSSFGSQTDLTGMEDAIQKKLEEVKKTLEEKTAVTPTDKMEQKNRNSLKKEDVISGKALFDYELKDQKGGQMIIKILDKKKSNNFEELMKSRAKIKNELLSLIQIVIEGLDNEEKGDTLSEQGYQRALFVKKDMEHLMKQLSDMDDQIQNNLRQMPLRTWKQQTPPMQSEEKEEINKKADEIEEKSANDFKEWSETDITSLTSVYVNAQELLDMKIEQCKDWRKRQIEFFQQQKEK